MTREGFTNLKYVQTSSSQQKTTLDICHLQPNGLATSEAHTQVHQRNYALQVPHLASATSRSLSNSSAVDTSSHQHLLCDSDWATDIDSRKSTSGTATSVLQVPLDSNSRTQSTVATSSAEAKLYAIGLGISNSLHIYQLLQVSTSSSRTDLRLRRLRQPRHSAQPYHIDNYKTIDIRNITDPHLYRQHICTQPQQQAWAQQALQAHRFALPL